MSDDNRRFWIFLVGMAFAIFMDWLPWLILLGMSILALLFGWGLL